MKNDIMGGVEDRYQRSVDAQTLDDSAPDDFDDDSTPDDALPDHVSEDSPGDVTDGPRDESTPDDALPDQSSGDSRDSVSVDSREDVSDDALTNAPPLHAPPAVSVNTSKDDSTNVESTSHLSPSLSLSLSLTKNFNAFSQDFDEKPQKTGDPEKGREMRKRKRRC